MQPQGRSAKDWTQTDLMKRIRDSKMYRQGASGARNWLEVRQDAPDCDLILSEQSFERDEGLL